MKELPAVQRLLLLRGLIYFYFVIYKNMARDLLFILPFLSMLQKLEANTSFMKLKVHVSKSAVWRTF